MTYATFRKLALQFDLVDEKPHFNKASFRIKEKIFATLYELKNQVAIKLPEIDQSIYCQIRPTFAMPATGAWGKQGWTIFNLEMVSKQIIQVALPKAYLLVAPIEKSKAWFRSQKNN